MKNLKILVAIVLLSSCSAKQNIKYKYTSDGKLTEIIIPENYQIENSKSIIYKFYDNGNIKSIQRMNKDSQLTDENLWFYNSGHLSKKIPFNNYGVAKGNAYFFYDSTGAIKNHRFYRNGKEVLLGGDYWNDSFGTLKSSLHFNDSGIIYYKKNFDKNGNFINEEGKRE